MGKGGKILCNPIGTVCEIVTIYCAQLGANSVDVI